MIINKYTNLINTRFLLFFAFKIPWLCTTFRSIPRPMSNSWSNYCQNSLLSKVSSHNITHRCVLVFIFYWNQYWFSVSSVTFSSFDLFAFYFQKVYCFSMTFHDPHFNFTAFQALKTKFIKSFDFPCFPWPVRTQMTCLSLIQFFPLTKAHIVLAAKSKYYNFT